MNWAVFRPKFFQVRCIEAMITSMKIDTRQILLEKLEGLAWG
jgi:hypothetical protein